MGELATPAQATLPGSDALGIDTLVPSRVVAPASPLEAAACLDEARRAGQAVVPWGSGTAQAVGAALLRYDLALLTSQMASVIEYEPADLVATVGAGIRIGDLQDVLRVHGQFLALDGVHRDATIGGIVATNRSGPSRLLYGTARDLVLGITAALPNGDVVRSGGRVVKNVVGYDLNKLHVGALGSLGVLCEVTLKVHPVPRAEASVVARFGDPSAANEVAHALARSNLALRAVDVTSDLDDGPTASATCVAAWCSGWPAAVDRQVRDVTAALRGAGATVVDARSSEDHASTRARVEAMRAREVRIKFAVLPASLGRLHVAVTRELRGAGIDDASWVGRAGIGIAHVGLDAVDERLVRSLRSAAEALDGNCVIESAPASLRTPELAWGRPRDDFRIMTRIRDEFDPARTLNPGRFVGGL